MQTITRPTNAAAMKAHDKGIVIGEGSSRRVFWKKGSYWAYKFIYSSSSNFDANKDEFANYLNIKNNLPEGINLPEMVLLDNGVLATQYIPGEQSATECWGGKHDCGDAATCWYSTVMMAQIERIRGFGDISWANVITTDDGKLYVIDLEF